MTYSASTRIDRHLITTADERLWKFDRPLLFLGEWCRRYARRNVWQSLDAIVAAPYGLEQEVRTRDHVRARAFEEVLLPYLCEALNRHHAVTHNERYWRILLGHWLRRYVEVLLNRYETLEVCLQVYRPSTLTVFADDGDTLAPQNSYAAIRAFDDAHWNARLFARLLGYMEASDIAVEVLPAEPQRDFEAPSAFESPRLLRRIRDWAKRKALVGASHLSRETDALIINSYLSRFNEVRLHVALMQFPQQPAGLTERMRTVVIDHALRHRMANEFITATADQRSSGLTWTLKAMLFELLPACYLEGYATLTATADALPWPREPRFIFTSNNFDTDELFKVWAADKATAGVPYIVGQHGANYGTSLYMNPSVEETTADRFITWGWKDESPQHVPGFLFKTAGKPQQRFNPIGGLLLVELHAGQMLTTWDSVAEFSQYFDEQQSFVDGLDPSIRNFLTVRLHHEHFQHEWDEVERWKSFDPKIRLDLGVRNIGELVAESRLVVHSYDSSGILETLEQNIPTLAFWQNNFSHLRESAKPYYQLLVEVGILHLNIQSVISHIHKIWPDVEEWWNSSRVQEVREIFCSRYARTSSSPVREMKKILLDCASQ